jgi:flagellar hook-length control protein FliK
LIAGLAQAVNQTDTQANRATAGQPALRPAAIETTQTPAPDTAKASAPQAAQPAPPATESAAAAVDAGNLASLIQTSTTAGAAEASIVPSDAISSAGNALGKKLTGKISSGEVAGDNAATTQQVLLPTPTTATNNASGNSQGSPPADSISSPVVPAGPPSGNQQITGPQPGTVTLFGSSFFGTATGQSAAFAAAPVDPLSLAAQVSTIVLPSNSASNATGALDPGNTAQLANTNDAHQAAQAPGSQDPGYLLFGAAPPSLQLQVANMPTTHAASSGSLSSFVLDQAAYAIQYSHANGQQMQLHLNPPELGALQVDVSMRDGVLSARIEAQTSAAQQILTDNISQLKDSLTQQGVSFDRIDVHLAGSNTGSGGAGSADKSFAQQQEGSLPWDQQFAQPESDESALRAPVPTVRNARIPLTSLDIMI